MPRYSVRMFFNSYKDLEIEAESEEKARHLALFTDFEDYDDTSFDFMEVEEITK